MVSNPEGDNVVRAGIAFGVICTVAVTLRLISRRKIRVAFAADDALIVASLVPLYAMIVIGHFSVEAGGLGLSTAENLELGHGTSRISTFLKLKMSTIIVYHLTIALVKLSILTFYRRIFPIDTFKRTALIVEAAVSLLFIVSVFNVLFQCRPFQAAFDPELIFTHSCIKLKTYYRGITAANLCLDVIILYMPLHMVWGLRLRTRQKIALSGIFLLGGNACAAGAMRLVQLGALRKDNLTYTTAKELLWTQIEPGLAILCACLVTFRPLFVDLNLQVSKFLTRFGRSKRQFSPKAPGSKVFIKERVVHLQWPGKRDFQHKESIRIGSEGRYTEHGLHHGTGDLGTTYQKCASIQISKPVRDDGDDIWEQQFPASLKYKSAVSWRVEDQEAVMYPFS